jgi:hypothetical protein
MKTESTSVIKRPPATFRLTIGFICLVALSINASAGDPRKGSKGKEKEVNEAANRQLSPRRALTEMEQERLSKMQTQAEKDQYIREVVNKGADRRQQQEREAREARAKAENEELQNLYKNPNSSSSSTTSQPNNRKGNLSDVEAERRNQERLRKEGLKTKEQLQAEKEAQTNLKLPTVGSTSALKDLERKEMEKRQGTKTETPQDRANRQQKEKDALQAVRERYEREEALKRAAQEKPQPKPPGQ